MGTSQSRNRLIGGTALNEAVTSADIDIVSRLLEPCLGINEKGGRWGDYTPLMNAILMGWTAGVELLLAAPGIDVNAKGEEQLDNTALMMAVESEWHTERLDIVELLLAAPGIGVNAKNHRGDTALMWAALNGHTDIVELLLAAGADVNAQNNDGTTALMMAERRGHTDVVRAINSFLAAQAMNRWIPRHRSRQRDRVGLSELDRGTTFMDLVYYHTQGFL